jgi:hypothetical protein
MPIPRSTRCSQSAWQPSKLKNKLLFPRTRMRNTGRNLPQIRQPLQNLLPEGNIAFSFRSYIEGNRVVLRRRADKGDTLVNPLSP